MGHTYGGYEHIREPKKISSYSGIVTANSTGNTVALAAGVSQGYGGVECVNLSTASEEFAIGAWGESAAAAISNLGISGGKALTGFIIPSYINGVPATIVDAPYNATHLALAIGTSGTTQSIMVNQWAP